MADKKLIRECALHYAKKIGLDLPDDMKDKAVIRAIEDHLGEQEDACEVCDHYIGDDDSTCWFCGSDVSPDGDGGWDRIKKSVGKSNGNGKKAGGKMTTKEFVESSSEEEPSEEEPPEEDLQAEEMMEQESPPVPEEPAPKKRGRPKKGSEKSGPIAGLLPEEDSVAGEPKSTGELTLSERTKFIRTLDRTTGGNAWRIGENLSAVKEGLYEQKYKTFEDYCQKELGWTAQTSYSYIRIANKFTEDEAGQLGVFKLLELTKAPEAALPKLFKQALPKLEGGKGLDRKELRSAISEAWEKEKETGNDRPSPKSPGRPAMNPFKRFVGTKVKGSFEEDSESYIVDLGDGVGIEAKITGKNNNRMSMEFVELADEVEEVVE